MELPGSGTEAGRPGDAMTHWRLVFLIGMIWVAVADEQYMIWTASSANGFQWAPGKRTYLSVEACEQAVTRRQQRVAREVEALRRIGAEETVLRTLGDRIYRCLPTGDTPPKQH